MIGFILLLGLAHAFLQSETGKYYLARMIERGLSAGSDRQVQLGKIKGYIPFEIECDSIKIGDDKGDWLSIKNIVLSWQPSLRIKERIFIHELSAQEIRLIRLPVGPNNKKAFNMPSWPLSIPGFQVDHFSFERLEVQESVYGMNAVFSITGRMVSNDPISGLTGFLQIDRTDMPGAFASIKWALTGNKPFLVLDANIQEPKNGLIQAMVGLKETGPSFFHLQGQGPFDNWKGHLSAKTESIGYMESAVDIKMGKTFRITAKGNTVFHSSYAPAIISPLIAPEGIPFMVDMEYGPQKKMVLHQAHLETDQSRIKLQGTIQFDKKRAQVAFDLGIKDLSLFSDYLGRPAQGNLTVNGELSGTMSRPLVKLSVSLLEPTFSDFSARRIRFETQMKSIGEFPSDIRGLHIDGKGVMDNLLFKGRNEYLPFDHYKWDMDADIRKGKPIVLNRLDIFADDLSTHFKGSFDYELFLIDGKASLDSNDLGRLTRIINREISGKAHLDTDLVADLKAFHIFADINGHIQDVTPLQPFLKELTEGNASFAGKMDLNKGRILALSDFQARSENSTVTGDCTIDLSTKDTTAKARISIPTLNVLSKPIHKALQGALETDLEVTGTYTEPKIAIAAIGEDITVEGVPFEHVWISVQAENLFEEPKGSVGLKFKKDGHAIDARTRASLKKQKLILKETMFSLADNHVAGNLELDLHTMMMTGSFKGSSNDLTSLAFLWGEPIQGRADVDMFLSKGDKGQDVGLKLQGKGIVSRFGRAEEVTAQLRLKDLFHTREGNINLECRSFQKGPVELKTLLLKAEGRPQQARFLISGNGHYRERFEMSTQGFYHFRNEEQLFKLENLKGHFGEYPIALTRPLILRRWYHNIEVEDVTLSLGQGIMTTTIKIASGDIHLKSQLNQIPLEMLHFAGFPYLSGTATVQTALSGRLDHPDGTIKIEIRGMKSKIQALQDIPEADLSVMIGLKNNRIHGDLILTGLSEKPIQANLQIPAQVSLSPFILSLARQGDIQGMASAEWNIKQTASLFYLEGHRLEGHAAIHLKIEGSLEKPNIKGGLRIDDGVYENALGGMVIKDIQVLATIVDDKLVLEKAQAKDGADGTIQGKGQLNLLREEDFPFWIDTEFNNMALIRRDDLSIITGGRLKTSGSMSGVTVSGQFTAARTELAIPDRLPYEIQTLEVVEINAPFQNKGEKPEIRQKFSGKLYLNVDIDAPGRIFIRGRGLESEWNGNLRVKGKADDVLITGNLSVIRGQYNFFGKSFTLTKGIITFDGQNPPAPAFDVTGEHHRADMTARIRVFGTPSAPTIDIESEPPMPSDEILSRLLFGKGVAHITPFQALKLAQAVNALRGNSGGILGFFDRTRKFLGVDQLAIDQSEETGGQAAISVGKYIGENVYVEMGKGLGKESGKVKVEVELTPNVSLESQVGEDSNGGIGINWKWDY